MELHINLPARILSLIFLIVLPVIVHAQCPTEAQLESGGTLNIPTDNDCSSAVACSITSANFWDINGNITVESCVTLDLNQNSSFIEIDGGTFTINEGATVNTNRRLVVTGATLIVNGNLNVGDGGGVDNLAVTGGGSIVVGATGNIDVGNGNVRVGTNGGTTGNLTVNGTLLTSGDLVIRNNGDLSGSGLVTYTGTFTNSGTTSESFTTCTGGSSNSSCGATTLPVKLLSFKTSLAAPGTAQLDWSTATELNNQGFYVEKSTDGIDFESIGFVEGNGTTDEQKHYQFYDQSVNGNSYYRLRQVDFDGQFEFSPIAFVQATEQAAIPQLGIYPNPVVSSFQFTASLEGVFDWALVNTSGQKLFSQQNLTVPQAELQLNEMINRLDAGTYMILMQNGEGRQHIRMLKR